MIDFFHQRHLCAWLANLGQGHLVVQDRILRHLHHDSRAIRPGDVFVALQGQRQDGRDFIDQAIACGAVLIITHAQKDWTIQKRLQDHVEVLKIPDLISNLGYVAATFYQYPSKKMQVHGITATNGKTSTVHHMAQLHEALNMPMGVIGTLGYGIYPNLDNKAPMTTPMAIDLQRHLAYFESKGIRHVAMEVSSHGLAQMRCQSVQFSTAAMMHIGQDHLDYHANMQQYVESKQKIFTDHDVDVAMITLDDDWSSYRYHAASSARRIVGLTQCDQDVDLPYALDARCHFSIGKSTLEGTFVQTSGSWGRHDMVLPLIGGSAVRNAMCALATLWAHGHHMSDCMGIISAIKPLKGRYDYQQMPNGQYVMIDYAHTPDALSLLLDVVRQVADKDAQITVIFGCGGQRDVSKRPRMGAIAAAKADRVILCDDNPRLEDPMSIIDDITQGMIDDHHVKIIPDRATAFESALGHSKSGDWIVLAGKGHEIYQYRHDGVHRYSDHEMLTNHMT